MNPLQDLLDRQALNDLVAQYSRAIDRRDFALLTRLYHPDAVHDHGPMFRGPPAAFVAWLKAHMTPNIATQHFVGNAIFAVSADRAEGEIYTINYHVTGGAHDYIAGGRYLDHYIKANDRWLFAARQRVIDWTHERATNESKAASGLARGTADPSDPSFAALPNLVRF